MDESGAGVVEHATGRSPASSTAALIILGKQPDRGNEAADSVAFFQRDPRGLSCWDRPRAGTPQRVGLSASVRSSNCFMRRRRSRSAATSLSSRSSISFVRRRKSLSAATSLLSRSSISFMVSFAVLALASPAELAASEAPLAAAIQKAWPAAENMLSAIALFATANTVLITVIASSRVAFSMARDKEIPTVFARLLHVRQTPWTAAVLTFVMAAVLIPIGSVKILAEMSSFAALVAFFAVNVVLIVLRYRMPRLKRPFRVPLAIGRLPVLPVLAIASIAVLIVHFEWQIYAAGAIALAASALAFLARQLTLGKRR
jgi:hypothetical protein